MPTPDTTIDSAEVAKFERMADEWWDPKGPFAPLHGMTPCRMDYILAQLCAEFERDRKADAPLSGLHILDIGCGGGLLSEPLARLGANVIGADAAGEALKAAEAHAARAGLTIDYRHTTAEALAAEDARFDAILAMEIIEHVSDPAAFLTACSTLLKPGGVFIASTLNKTAKSFALAIVGAEYILRWLPKGTHDWSKFIPPETLVSLMETSGLDPVDRKGMVYDPLADRWSLSDRDLSVNYVVTALKPNA